MKCQFCGYEENGIFFFCPNCGQAASAPTESQQQTPAPDFAQNPNENFAQNPDQNNNPYYSQNPQPNYQPYPTQDPAYGHCPTPRIMALVKDGLFLTICILLTVSGAFSILGGKLDLLTVLLAIFAWIVYADSRKNVLSHEHLRCISGTVYATYVIQYVIAGLSAFLGLICILFSNNSAFLEMQEIQDILNEIPLDFTTLSISANAFLSILILVTGIILLIVAAVTIVINILGFKKIHAFVKSVYESVQNGFENFADPKKAHTWIIVLAVFAGFSFFSEGHSFAGLVATGCTFATLIIGNILIGKYLTDK